MMNRRKFLKSSGLGLGVAAGFASNLASFNAYAANTSDYKALVCVFLKGGMDSHDMIIPIDVSQSALYEGIREPILGNYTSNGWSSRRLSDGKLATLGGGGAVSGSVADGRSFALPDEMKSLRNIYRERNLAVVANVGPLVEPMNRTTYLNKSANRPPRLFSHNDQQSIWMANSPEGAGVGWGGRMGDFMQSAGANTHNSFTAVSVNNNSVFLNGENVSNFALSSNGGLTIKNIGARSYLGSQTYIDMLNENIYNAEKTSNNFFQSDLADITKDTVEQNILLNALFQTSPDPTTSFPDTSLGKSLKVVAKMISQRAALGMRRQIFFVSDAGYDHHSNQGGGLPEKQYGISEALTAFYNETKVMDLQDSVCTFTASDFGRTLVPNSTGTDHGWGSHHLVMGGGVNGGRIFGDIPEPVIGHDQDAGRGTMIPELAVDQYAFSLARWFGLTYSEAHAVLPNASNHNPRKLYGMFMDDWL